MNHIICITHMTQKISYSWRDAFVNCNRCSTCDENIIHHKLKYKEIMDSRDVANIKIKKIDNLCNAYQIYDCCRFKLIAVYGYPNLPSKGG